MSAMDSPPRPRQSVSMDPAPVAKKVRREAPRIVPASGTFGTAATASEEPAAGAVVPDAQAAAAGTEAAGADGTAVTDTAGAGGTAGTEAAGADDTPGTETAGAAAAGGPDGTGPCGDAAGRRRDVDARTDYTSEEWMMYCIPKEDLSENYDVDRAMEQFEAEGRALRADLEAQGITLRAWVEEEELADTATSKRRD
jgi:hypothetical protein